MMQAHIPPPAVTTRPSGTEVGVFDPPVSDRATSEFNVASVTIPVDGHIELHSHVEREMWFVTHGAGVLTVAGEQSPAQAGDGLYFESNQKHGLQNTGDSPLRLIAVYWMKAE